MRNLARKMQDEWCSKCGGGEGSRVNGDLGYRNESFEFVTNFQVHSGVFLA